MISGGPEHCDWGAEAWGQWLHAKGSFELAKAKGVFLGLDVFACLGFASMIMVHSRCNLGIEKLCESLEFCLLDKMFMNLGVHLGHNLKLNLPESFLICNIGNPGGGTSVSCQESVPALPPSPGADPLWRRCLDWECLEPSLEVCLISECGFSFSTQSKQAASLSWFECLHFFAWHSFLSIE